MKKTLIILILLIIYGCNESLEFSSEDIEEKYNIYISKLSNEQIQENLNKGLKPKFPLLFLYKRMVKHGWTNYQSLWRDAYSMRF